MAQCYPKCGFPIIEPVPTISRSLVTRRPRITKRQVDHYLALTEKRSRGMTVT